MKEEEGKPSGRRKAKRKNQYLEKIERMGVESEDLGLFNYQRKSRNKDCMDKVSKNRESAVRSRKRKQAYIRILESKLDTLSKENQRLREQLMQNNRKMSEIWKGLSQSERTNQMKLKLLEDLRTSGGVVTSEIKEAVVAARKLYSFDSTQRKRQFESAHLKAMDVFLPIFHRFLMMEASDGSSMLQLLIYSRECEWEWAQAVRQKLRMDEKVKKESQFLAMRFKSERQRLLERLLGYERAKQEMYAAASELNRVVLGIARPIEDEAMITCIIELILNSHRPELNLSHYVKNCTSPDDFLNRVLF